MSDSDESQSGIGLEYAATSLSSDNPRVGTDDSLINQHEYNAVASLNIYVHDGGTSLEESALQIIPPISLFTAFCSETPTEPHDNLVPLVHVFFNDDPAPHIATLLARPANQRVIQITVSPIKSPLSLWPEDYCVDPLATPPDPYDDVIEALGPIAYWKYDNVSGSTITDIIGGFSGTKNSGVTLAQSGQLPDDSGTCARFDGITGIVTVPHEVELVTTDAFSIELTATIEDTADAILLGKTTAVFSAPYAISTYQLNPTANLILVRVQDQTGQVGGGLTGSGEVVVTRGRRFHLAVTCSSTQLKVYLDSELLYTSPVTGPFIDDGGPICMGGRPAASAPFKGLMEKVSLFDYELSAAEVKANFAAAMRITTEFSSPWMDKGIAFFKSWWDPFVAAIVTAGATLAGVVLDWEISGFNHTGWVLSAEHIAAIYNDPRFSAGDPSPASLFNATPDLVNFAAHLPEFLRWNAVSTMLASIVGNAAVGDSLFPAFPGAMLTQYAGGSAEPFVLGRSPGVDNPEYANPAHAPIDYSGYPIDQFPPLTGTHQSLANYGVLQFWGIEANPYRAFCWSVGSSRALRRASNTPNVPWGIFYSWVGIGSVTYNGTPYYKEEKLHRFLCQGTSIEFHFNPSGVVDGNPALGIKAAGDDALVSSILTEFQIATQGAITITPLISTNVLFTDPLPDAVISGALCQGISSACRVFRITFNEGIDSFEFTLPGEISPRTFTRPVDEVGMYFIQEV